jgi:outer membrane protein OmpA-like peptidoglycan-associated protein
MSTMSIQRVVCTVSVAMLVASTAQAQESEASASQGVALDQFRATPAGDAFEGVATPTTSGHIVLRGKLSFDYAKDPLVLIDPSGKEIGDVVSSQAFVTAGASLALWDRILVAADLPVAVMQSGDNPSHGDVTVTSPSRPGIGDLRVIVRGRLVGDYWSGFQAAIQGKLFAPTGPKNSYIGDGQIYGGGDLIIGGRLPHFVWGGSAGTTLHASSNPTTIDYAAAVGVVLLDDRLQIGPEAFGGYVVDASNLFEGQGVEITRQGTVNAEGLLAARYRFGEDFVLAAGGGMGFSNGVGTPRARAVASFSYAPRPTKGPGDADGDGITDDIDACPNQQGKPSDDKATTGCPPPPDGDGDGVPDADDDCPKIAGDTKGCPDSDGDSIIDKLDACPKRAGVAANDKAKNGCPPDSDGDGVADPDDACPDAAGEKHDDAAKNGCPPDDDGDGIPNADDKCLNVRGKVNTEDPERHGCPKDVRVTETEIIILKKVHFAFGKAGIEDAIDPISSELLDEVRTVIEDHPEIEQVEVQGHTDSKGELFFNMRLSQKRAESVRQFLIDKGIAPDKLVAKGYGPLKPIAPNYKTSGREKNRRVGFKILKRKK